MTDGRVTARELIDQLTRLAAMGSYDPTDNFSVHIVATRAAGEDYTIIYRQGGFPHLFGVHGNATEFSALFEPQQSARSLAGILLQSMSEPNGPGRAGPHQWAEGLVPNPADVGWLTQ